MKGSRSKFLLKINLDCLCSGISYGISGWVIRGVEPSKDPSRAVSGRSKFEKISKNLSLLDVAFPSRWLSSSVLWHINTASNAKNPIAILSVSIFFTYMGTSNSTNVQAEQCSKSITDDNTQICVQVLFYSLLNSYLLLIMIDVYDSSR